MGLVPVATGLHRMIYTLREGGPRSGGTADEGIALGVRLTLMPVSHQSVQGRAGVRPVAEGHRVRPRLRREWGGVAAGSRGGFCLRVGAGGQCHAPSHLRFQATPIYASIYGTARGSPGHPRWHSEDPWVVGSPPGRENGSERDVPNPLAPTSTSLTGAV
jgi:hypothetical protein